MTAASSRRHGALHSLFETPAKLLARLAGKRPRRRAWIDPRLEQEKIAAVADLLRKSGAENLAHEVESLLIFDAIVIVELGQRRRDSYLQLISVQYLSRFDAYRVDWRERVEGRAVRLGLADFDTAEQVVAFVEQCVTKYRDQTEVPDAPVPEPLPIPQGLPPVPPRRY